jgi:hypothetical protein
MSAIGLGDWTFAEGDAAALRRRLDRLSDLGDDERRHQLTAAREALVRRFAWDDYWPRVLQRLDEDRRCA